MCMLLGMSKQLVYAFPGFYNKETISSNNLWLKFVAEVNLGWTILNFHVVCTPENKKHSREKKKKKADPE